MQFSRHLEPGSRVRELAVVSAKDVIISIHSTDKIVAVFDIDSDPGIVTQSARIIARAIEKAVNRSIPLS
jgi:putative methionine-R-sulfoxide reductase with GAF domain